MAKCFLETLAFKGMDKERIEEIETENTLF
jgi:hypothetical protein